MSLPRIMCLHGGGSNAEIFNTQMRGLTRLLSSDFRLVFAEGPFVCNAGPGIEAVYGGWGTIYRRWVRWLPDEHPDIDDETVIGEIEYSLESAMKDDDDLGGTGPWVGVLGFSQGAKIAASIVYDYDLRLRVEDAKQKARLARIKRGGAAEADILNIDPGFAIANRDPEANEAVKGIAGGQWRFAICLAGRAPLVRLSKYSESVGALVNAGGISEGGVEYDNVNYGRAEMRLGSLHVHGLQDPGLELHQRLVRRYCAEGSAKVIEWDGGHRVPLKTSDLRLVADGIRALAEVSLLFTFLEPL